MVIQERIDAMISSDDYWTIDDHHRIKWAHLFVKLCLFYLFISVCTHACKYAMAHTWRSENKFCEPISIRAQGLHG